jgi:hypothetical protein
VSKKSIQILAAPETNLFLFAFLLNFVYEVWQAPYYEFYASPSLADKIRDLTHCSFGDGAIVLVCSWVMSALVRSRNWVLYPTWKQTFLFTSIGLAITLFIETYRPKFNLIYGSIKVGIRVLGWEVNPWETPELAIVRACSCITVGSHITLELTEYLLRENLRMRFGAFQLGDNNEIFFAHNILGGEQLDVMELQTCILAVVTIADTYDDILTAKFGGVSPRLAMAQVESDQEQH